MKTQKKETGKVIPPDRVVVKYGGEPNEVFEEALGVYLSYLDLTLAASGYSVSDQVRDLEFVKTK